MATSSSSLTLKAPSAASAFSSPSSTGVQHFLQRVYIHIKEDRLPSALQLIEQEGEKFLKNDSAAAKAPILETIAPTDLTPDARAEKFVSVLQKLKDIFPSVKPEDFEKVRMQQNSSSAIHSIIAKDTAAVSSIIKREDHSEILKKVKILGQQAGLSEREVNASLEEIAVGGGRKMWMIKTVPNDPTGQYKVWESLLVTLAADKEIILFCESHIRADHWEKLSCLYYNAGNDRGFFRGLETEKSKFCIDLVWSMDTLAKIKAKQLSPDQLLEPIHAVLSSIILNTSSWEALQRQYKQKVDDCPLKEILEKRDRGELTIGNLYAFIKDFFDTVPLNKWDGMLSLLFAFAHQESSPSLKKAIENWLTAFAKIEGALPSSYHSLYQQFTDEWNRTRSPAYSRIFKAETASMPKEKPCFVFFESDHALGFKQGLLGLGIDTRDNGDRADSKESKTTQQ